MSESSSDGTYSSESESVSSASDISSIPSLTAASSSSSRATVTCDGHGIYAHRHRAVAFVTALVALEIFKMLPLWLHAALLLAFGTRLGFTAVPPVVLVIKRARC